MKPTLMRSAAWALDVSNPASKAATNPLDTLDAMTLPLGWIDKF